MLAQQEDERHLRSRPAKFHVNLAERGAALPKADGTLVSALGGGPSQKILGYVTARCARFQRAITVRMMRTPERGCVSAGVRVMTRRFVKLLAAAVALGAFISALKLQPRDMVEAAGMVEGAPED